MSFLIMSFTFLVALTCRGNAVQASFVLSMIPSPTFNEKFAHFKLNDCFNRMFSVNETMVKHLNALAFVMQRLAMCDLVPSLNFETFFLLLFLCFRVV